MAPRSDRAIPPAPKLAWRTRSDGLADNKRGRKKGPASAPTAPALRNERRVNRRDWFMRNFYATASSSAITRTALRKRVRPVTDELWLMLLLAALMIVSNDF